MSQHRQNSKYQKAVSTSNIGAKSRAQAMLTTSGDPKNRRTEASAPRQAPSHGPCGAGFRHYPSTMINPNGSGYDNPKHHDGLARSRMMKTITMPAGPLPAAGNRVNISAVSDYRSPTRNRFK